VTGKIQRMARPINPITKDPRVSLADRANANADKAELGALERRGDADVNPVQRRGELRADSPGPIQIGAATFSGASGPVGEDGQPLVLHHGTRSDLTASRLAPRSIK